MARSNFGPEVKAAMAEKSKTKPSAAMKSDMQRDKQRGIKEGSPQDEAIDAAIPNQAPQAPQISPTRPPTPGSVAHNNTVSQTNPAHAAIAASIAHAILGKGA